MAISLFLLVVSNGLKFAKLRQIQVMSFRLSHESVAWTRFCLSQPISPAHPRARDLPPGDRGGKECIQHAQHFHEPLLIVNLPLEQVLETLQLAVHH